MRTLTTLALVGVVGGVPAAGSAEDAPSIRASAERLVAEAAQLDEPAGGGRSAARIGTALGLVVTGAAMTLLEPTQPVQPTQPSVVDLRDYLGPGVYPGHSYRLVHRRGSRYGGRWICPDQYLWCRITDRQLRTNYVNGYTDGYDDGWYYGRVQGHREGWAQGHARGQRSMIEVIDENGFVVYEGPFKPYVPWKERSPGLKYGGVALAVAGALVAVLWREGPQVTGAPTPGGARAAVSIGF